MSQNLRLEEGGEELSAHVVRDDSVLQPKHMQGGDLEGSVVEHLVFCTRAAETSDKDGKAEAELRLQSFLLKRAQHGNKSCSLAEAQDAVKWSLDLNSFPYSRHTLIKAQAFHTVLLSIEASSLDVRKPPAPLFFITHRART